MDGLPAATYAVTAVASGYAPAAEQTVAIAPTGAATADFALAGGSRVHGRVTDRASGRPLAGAQVELEGTVDVGGAPLKDNSGTRTDARGGFTFGGVQPGRTSIIASADGHHSFVQTGLHVDADADVGPIEISLRPLAEGEKPTIELTGIGASLGVKDD